MPNPNNITQTPDESATTAAAAPAPAPAADEPDVEEQALAALDEALTTDESAAPVGGTDKPEGEGEGGKTVDSPAVADPGKKPTDEPQPGEAPKAGEDTAKSAEPDKATEEEITTLGLKEKAASRFRELSGEVKALAPLKEVIKQAGIKDIAELPSIVQDAGAGREIFKQIQETGANAEQYGMALDYLGTVTRAMQGDMKAAEQAYAVMSGELTVLAKLLGKDVPGIVDPLADHADLKGQVDNGDLPRGAALEIARARQQAVLRETHEQTERRRIEGNDSRQRAITQAAADLDVLGSELAKIDPYYAAKAPALIAQLQVLRDALPPERWVAKARALYATIPNPAPAAAAPAPAKPMPGPVRGVGVRPAIVPVTDDPFEALEQGIAEANGTTWTG